MTRYVLKDKATGKYCTLRPVPNDLTEDIAGAWFWFNPLVDGEGSLLGKWWKCVPVRIEEIA